MNKLNTTDRSKIVSALVEGNSIRSTVRMTGTAKRTVTRLMAELGAACREYQNQVFMNIPCQKVQCDEIWSFCGMKEKNVPPEMKGKLGFGDVYTFVALCPDCKLVPSYLVAQRTPAFAGYFMRNLSRRINHRIQITTDGYNGYKDAVLDHFGKKADFCQLVKVYSRSGRDAEGEVRYSPADVVGTKKHVVTGEPNPEFVSTSLVERQNLTMRMGMRRFTRLTNGFSKKIENLRAAVSLHFMHYNFCRVHKSLGMTPAMKAGYADHVWTLEELVGLLDGWTNSNFTESK